MPMTRYQVRNEYSLADPELYKAADKDDPEALLEGVAMAGLVGVLRQLGDLAEFAAEIFHDLHEEVMVTAARGHTLMARVQQLETEFPPIEKGFLSRTSHSTFFFNSGMEWHPNLQMNQNLVTKGDLPRFVMDSYEEARGPPRLFLLDKFDIAGAGSCLKRYTDPSFYKVEASFLDMASADVQRDKKIRKAKKKGPRWKHGETPEILPSSKLHQLFLEERVESGASDPARLVKLKRKSSASSFGSENGKSYMEKFLKTPPEDKMVHEVSVGSSPLKLPSKSTTQILEVSNVGSDAEPVQRIRGPYPPPSLGRAIVSPSENDFVEDIVEEKTSVGPTPNRSFDDKDILVDGEIKVGERESNHSDYDDASEIDSYMDALATMESEVETDTESKSKSKSILNDEQLLNQSQSQSQFSAQSIGNFSASDDGNSSIRKGVSSFSCSDDTASTSAEDTPSPSNQDSIIESVRVDPLPDHEASDNAFTELAEIHAVKSPSRSSIDQEAIFVEDDKSGELESSDASSEASEILSDPTKTVEQQTDDKSEISSGPTRTEEREADQEAIFVENDKSGEPESSDASSEASENLSDATKAEELQTDDKSEILSGPMKSEEREADGSGEISSDLTEIKEQPTDDNGNVSDGLSETEEQLANVDDILEKRDEITLRLSYEKHLEDEVELVTDKANILEEIHETEGNENLSEDVIQTKYVENVFARNSLDTQIMSPDSVISHPEEQPSVLHLEGQAGNTNDDLSDKFDSAEIGLDGARDGKLSLYSESDVEEGEIESRVNPMVSDFLSNVSEYQDRPSSSDNHSESDGRDDKIVHPAEDEVDSSDHFNHKFDTNTEFDSSELTTPTQPLEHETELRVEELDVGPVLVGKVTRKSSQLDLFESDDTDHESRSGPTSGEASVSELPQTSNYTFDLFQKVNAPLNQPSSFPGFNLLPEVAPLISEEMPPLPPLPPMQWRTGKLSVPSGRDDGQQVNHFPPFFPSIRNENVQASNPFPPLPPTNVANSRHEDLMPPSEIRMVNFASFLMPMPPSNLEETQSLNPFATVSATNSEKPQEAGEGVVIQPTVDHIGSCNDHLTLDQSQSSNHFEAESAPSDEKPQHAEEGDMMQPTVDHSDIGVDFIALGQTQSSNPSSSLPETRNEIEEMIQPTEDGPTSTFSSETPNEESNESTHQLLTEESLGKEEQDCPSVVSEAMAVGPPKDFVSHPVENRLPEQPGHVEPTAEDAIVCSSSFVDDEKPYGNQIPKLPRPRSPLIDAVAAHDKSKLRKVVERVRPQEQKTEEKDSILEQIRMKSFNLKPAVATRPTTIHGPRTNLRVAAILEKANAIRQAFAGSDDDDDDDWSDS